MRYVPNFAGVASPLFWNRRCCYAGHIDRQEQPSMRKRLTHCLLLLRVA